MKKIVKYLLCFLCLFGIVGCEKEKVLNYNYNETKKYYEIEGSRYKEVENESNLVKIEVENYGIIIAELYPEIAPITVANFKKLVGENFYDGLIFHRVIKDFMIQTGDPTGTGTGGSEETIKGEFADNDVINDLSHTSGVLSIARKGAKVESEATWNSASSQFFIVHQDSTYLDGKYAAFGKVVQGMDVVDKIASTPVDSNDKPLKEQKILTIRFVDEYTENK